MPFLFIQVDFCCRIIPPSLRNINPPLCMLFLHTVSTFCLFQHTCQVYCGLFLNAYVPQRMDVEKIWPLHRCISRVNLSSYMQRNTECILLKWVFKSQVRKSKDCFCIQKAGSGNQSLTFHSISRHLWDWHPNYWNVNSFLKRKMGCTFKLVRPLQFWG